MRAARLLLLVWCVLGAGCTTASLIGASELGAYSPAADRRLADVASPTAGFVSSPANAAVEAPPAVAPAATTANVEVVRRQVIYSAGLRLVVVSIAEAMSSVQRFAADAGGYLQESDARSITVRVPAAAFDVTVARIAMLGEIVDRNVRASDVTEQYVDLEIRLDNARKTRVRLLEHLKGSLKLEDTIKLEAELARVSTEIEQVEGKLRFMRAQIALSTIRVELNTTQPQRSSAATATPFDWIARLGDGLVAGTTEAMPRQPRFFAGGPKFEPPPGFVRYFSDKNLVEALDADGVRIKVQRHANFDRAPIDFWRTLARKALVEGRAITVTREWSPEKLAVPSLPLVGTREVAGKTYVYLLALSRTNDEVYTYEAWGPRETFDQRLAELVASAKTIHR